MNDLTTFLVNIRWSVTYNSDRTFADTSELTVYTSSQFTRCERRHNGSAPPISDREPDVAVNPAPARDGGAGRAGGARVMHLSQSAGFLAQAHAYT